MRVDVCTKEGKIIRCFVNVDEVRNNDSFYEILYEDDEPSARVYGKENVILIYYARN